jgi:hypothetical protein
VRSSASIVVMSVAIAGGFKRPFLYSKP